MTSLKLILHRLAWLCRLLRNICDHWVKIVIVLCILSPISPHLRINYDCTYVGTRGIIYASAKSCPLIRIIDTRDYRKAPLW